VSEELCFWYHTRSIYFSPTPHTKDNFWTHLKLTPYSSFSLDFACLLTPENLCLADCRTDLIFLNNVKPLFLELICSSNQTLFSFFFKNAIEDILLTFISCSPSFEEPGAGIYCIYNGSQDCCGQTMPSNIVMSWHDSYPSPRLALKYLSLNCAGNEGHRIIRKLLSPFLCFSCKQYFLIPVEGFFWL